MDNRTVSVVIAAHNSERTIEKCLLSIKNQTYKNIDIVVVDSLYYDEANQKKCKTIIQKYARYFQDGPERSVQRNRGIREAKGDYILVIDQDMYLTPRIAEECYKTLSAQDFISASPKTPGVSPGDEGEKAETNVRTDSRVQAHSVEFSEADVNLSEKTPTVRSGKFINDNKIVTLYKNVPSPLPNTPLNQLPRYKPKEPAAYVLEIHSGLSEKYGFQEGDSVELRGLR